MNNKPLFTADDLIKELVEINPQTSYQREPMKQIEGETVIGPLSEYLLRIWLLLDKYCGICEEEIAKLNDLIAVHSVEHEQDCGEDKCYEFHNKIKVWEEKILTPATKWRVLDDLFWSLTEAEFGLSSESHLGIRDGKILVSCKDGSRGDRDNIFKGISGIDEVFGGTIVMHLIVTEKKRKEDKSFQNN